MFIESHFNSYGFMKYFLNLKTEKGLFFLKSKLLKNCSATPKKTLLPHCFTISFISYLFFTFFSLLCLENKKMSTATRLNLHRVQDGTWDLNSDLLNSATELFFSCAILLLILYRLVLWFPKS